jgi:hypothetical protein
MAQTPAQRSAAAKKAAATRRRRAAARTPTAATRRPAAAHRQGHASTPIERTGELSEQVLESIKSGQREAIDAVRKFMDNVDHALPPHTETGGTSRREELIDSALEMADRLVKAQYDFLRGVVHSAGKSLREKK